MNLILIDWDDNDKFWSWCVDRGCQPKYQGVCDQTTWCSRWHVPDKKLYIMALLQWSQ